MENTQILTTDNEQNKAVGSFYIKPHKDMVVITICGELSEVIFCEAYTPDLADQLAARFKEIAERARKGESDGLHEDEIEILKDEGNYGAFDPQKMINFDEDDQE